MTPEQGTIIIEVKLIAPKKKSMTYVERLDDTDEYSGTVKVVNKHDANDYA